MIQFLIFFHFSVKKANFSVYVTFSNLLKLSVYLFFPFKWPTKSKGIS